MSQTGGGEKTAVLSMNNDSNIGNGKIIGEWPFRVLAFGIDFLPVILMRCIFGLIFFCGVTQQSHGILFFLLITVTYAVIDWAYLLANFVYLVGKNGQSLGMRVMGLRIVGTDVTNVSYWQALGRFFAFILTAWTIIGILWALWDERCQTWHDKLAKTIVIQAPSPIPLVGEFRKFKDSKDVG